MRVQRAICRRVFPTIFGMLFLPAISPAQYISVKSIPLASGEQFMVYPSRNLGMGGISIALDDPLLDPFVNPAKGSRLPAVRLFGSPTFYNIANNNGAAQTVPLGALFRSEEWFGGVSVAVQQLEAPERTTFFPVLRTTDVVWTPPVAQSLLSDRNSNNLYLTGLLGTQLPGSRISIGGAVSWYSLDAVDGVELLYPRSSDVRQFGHMVDYRIGLVSELENQGTFEMLLLYNRFNMTHDVSYPAWFSEEGSNRSSIGTVVERNLDRTRTWGLHLGVVQPLPQDEWRLGGIFTINRKSHPKIPNYELMNIPRDPGTSWAFNIGGGIARTNGPATFGLDLIVEPIWSHTWAEASEPVVSRSGRIIPAGGKTVDNQFKFTNWVLRIGIGRQEEVFGFQFGLQVHWIRYRLDQEDKVQEFQRFQEEGWAEWTPSMSLSWSFPEFQIRYTGRLTAGTGRPGVAQSTRATADAAVPMNGFIVAPSGPLTLQETLVLTHQISISVPIGD